MSIKAIILAAGKGTRMQSSIPKVMHKVNGVPMLERILKTLMTVGLTASDVVTILGDKKEYILEKIPSLPYVVQEEQLGTGHAIKITADFFKSFQGDVIITCGDAPLIKEETYKKLIETHQSNNYAMTIVTTSLDNPFGYGRIVKDVNGQVVKMVEEKDATEKERLIQEINTGLYCINSQKLFQYIHKIKNNNTKKEFYLTDIAEIFNRKGESVATVEIDDFSQMVGVNTKTQLAYVSGVLRERKNQNLMDQGVILIDPKNCYIEEDVVIGEDSEIWPNVYITGKTVIGQHCKITENTRIESSVIHDHVVVKSSVIEESIVESYSDIGPFAHLRPLAHLKEHVHVGNFVEVKKATLEKGVKAGHLTYIGDSLVGENSNIGCGTITCNYDGKRKHQTIIGKNNFVGSDTKFIAPVKTADNVVIAAGTVLTKDVPEDSLVISRPNLVIKEGYYKK